MSNVLLNRMSLLNIAGFDNIKKKANQYNPYHVSSITAAPSAWMNYNMGNMNLQAPPSEGGEA